MEDNPYFKFISVLRGDQDSRPPELINLKLGEMLSDKSMSIDGLVIDLNDSGLFKAQGLLLAKGDHVLVAIMEDGDDMIIICKVVKA